ncbi:hypothetical protein Zmor_012890 [Zophobas morio]|uniref:Regulatory protein zeste n=1 Tax=Zophobas morio TaxID=2755281 RepID=A0AA38IGD4_9CUCU|nr:hypothetical protein Zmor_012890 [Zophobas morio]
MNSERERVRSKNFETQEICLLVDLVRQNKKVIECKETGIVNNKQKGIAWEKLTETFNAISGTVPRTSRNLKDKWTNLKKTAVRNFAHDKKYARGTGGGPSKGPTETSVDATVREILGDRLTGLPAVCDNDDVEEIRNGNEIEDSIVPEIENEENMGTSNSFFTENSASSSQLVLEEDVVAQPGDTQENELDWSQYTPRMLKKLPSKPLHVSKKGKIRVGGNITNYKWCQLADEKRNNSVFKKKLLEEDHKQKQEIHAIMKNQLQEEHEQKLRHREEEHCVKLKLMQEEHALRMTLLKQQITFSDVDNNQ